mmetsp:Transcript_28927/g.39757  ORF Transcript_28927/g.39757 Transcript_28927/m.39757 type:complete len:87 (+) Transcript_28927:27-287(+)
MCDDHHQELHNIHPIDFRRTFNSFLQNFKKSASRATKSCEFDELVCEVLCIKHHIIMLLFNPTFKNVPFYFPILLLAFLHHTQKSL